MKIKSIFRYFRGNVDEKKKWDLLLDQYIKSFERFEEKCFFEKINLLHSSYLKKMYILSKRRRDTHVEKKIPRDQVREVACSMGGVYRDREISLYIYPFYRIWIRWYGLYQFIVVVWEWVNSHTRGN